MSLMSISGGPDIRYGPVLFLQLVSFKISAGHFKFVTPCATAVKYLRKFITLVGSWNKAVVWNFRNPVTKEHFRTIVL